jgi:hypothetical protein
LLILKKFVYNKFKLFLICYNNFIDELSGNKWKINNILLYLDESNPRTLEQFECSRLKIWCTTKILSLFESSRYVILTKILEIFFIFMKIMIRLKSCNLFSNHLFIFYELILIYLILLNFFQLTLFINFIFKNILM